MRTLVDGDSSFHSGAIFRLYTRGSAKEFLFRDNAINFKDSKFDGNKKTVMIIHGYNGERVRVHEQVC